MSEPAGSDCPSREELRAYGLANVSKDAMETISDHLKTCDTCISALVALDGSDDSLIEGLRHASPDERFLDESHCREALANLEFLGFFPAVADRPGDETDDDLPEQFGRYRIVEELGRGGMGTVYLAEDSQLGRRVALKIPHFRRQERPHLLQRFYREARAAAGIDHPNVCPIYDVGEIDGIPYLSMARIDGRSLREVLKTGKRLEQREAAQLVATLARAVQTAHARGVVHRDIKPSNVMIDDAGEPILTDFGLARHVELEDTRLTHSGLIVGTPSYMAPEQVDGDPETIGPACDVYSLGVVLYELLTGKVPFSGPLLSVLSQLGKDQPKPPSTHRPDLDKRLEAICLKAIAKTPEDRYRSAAELAEALEEYLKHSFEDPVRCVLARTRTAQGPRVRASTHPTDSPDAASPPSRWRRLAWGSAAGAAAFFLLGILIYVKTGQGTLVLEVNQPDVKVTIDGKRVEIKSPRDEISVTVGRHALEVSKDGFHTHTDAFTIRRRNGKVELSVKLTNAEESKGSARYEWHEYGAHKYALTRKCGPAGDGFGSWTDAENEANDLGGHLVAIGDEEENQWLLETFGHSNTKATGRIWIGLYKQPGSSEPNDGWELWSNGDKVDYVNWYPPKEPNNHNGERFVHMYVKPSGAREGFWNDWKHAEVMMPGIVEIVSKSPRSQQTDSSWKVDGWVANLAVDSSGNVYASDIEHSCVKKFTSIGIRLPITFPTEARPSGIAIDSSGNVYVGDSVAGFVRKFSSGGTLLNSWKSPSPTGLAFDSSDNLYVGDNRNNRIYKYSTSGELRDTWSDDMDLPSGIASSPRNGSIYTVQQRYKGGVIQERSPLDGTILKQWGSYRYPDNAPEDIAVDQVGNIYVTVPKQSKIQKYSIDGNLISERALPGAGVEQLSRPIAIAVDKARFVYWGDSNNRRIRKYAPFPTTEF